jgi:uncharacterized membrane protein (GlpM family)
MDIPHETTLLAKVVWSAAVVLGLSAVAERVSMRIAGILAGAPQNVVLVYFFVGRDMGIDHVTQSTPHAIASFSATIAFALAYYWGSSYFPRYSAVAGALIGVAAFTVAAGILSTIPFTLTSATTLTLCVMGLAVWLVRRIELMPLAMPVGYTPSLLLLRGTVAAVLIVGVITLAEILGTRWTGLLTGFPTIVLPTLLIIHLTYGAAQTHAIIRNFPVGMGSIILYILSVPITFPRWGVYGGTAASLAVSFLYLAAVALIGRRHRASAPPDLNQMQGWQLRCRGKDGLL